MAKSTPTTAELEEEGDQPQIACPQCGAWEDDFDGFMVAHTKPEYENGCGWCSHPSRDGGVCGICGNVADRLWNVTLATEVVVKADSKEEAEKIAEDSSGDIISSGPFGYEATPTMIDCKGEKKPCLPMGWEMKTIPYGAEADETIQDILKK